jgi:hypothetical protein
MRARISVGLIATKRVSTALGLVVAVALLGCGSSKSLSVDGAADAGDATGDAVDGDRTSVDAADAPASRRCTPGADQTCNDDPRVSSLWGACDNNGLCSCKDGFSVNPATGRCRLGSSCVAAAADAWPFRLELDATGCAGRAAMACPNASFDRQAFDALRSGSCQLPSYLDVRVELVDGCATLLEARSRLTTTPSSTDMQFLSCLAPLLEQARFVCGAAKDCIMEETDTLP